MLERVSSIDLMPTLLDLLDVPLSSTVQQQLRGQSLIPNMRGEVVTRNVYAETDYRQFTYQRAIITPEGWKLIYKLENRSRELFNLNEDPNERRNLATSEASHADQLQADLFEYYRRLGCDLQARSWQPGMNPVYDLKPNP